MPESISNTPPSEQHFHPSNKADLLALRAERASMRAEINALADDDEANRRIGGLVDLEVAIVSATATTFADALVQLEQVVQWSADASGRVPNRTEKALDNLLARLKAELDRGAPAQADAHFLTLWADYRRAYIDWADKYDAYQVADDDAEKAGLKRIEETASEIKGAAIKAILDAPAESPTGLAVKLWLTWQVFDVNLGPPPDFAEQDLGDRALWCALDALEQMGAPERPWLYKDQKEGSIVALEAEMLRYRNAVDAGGLSDDEANRLGEKWITLTNQIAGTRARTLPDLAAKLRILDWEAENYGDGWPKYKEMARSVREDAERLAAGTA